MCIRDRATIVARANQLIGKMRQHFMVDDLKFLRKGGRLSGAAAFAGTLLQIKPILQGDPEGKIVVLSKERGRKKARDTLIPVSYTHLDVYKRQVFCSYVPYSGPLGLDTDTETQKQKPPPGRVTVSVGYKACKQISTHRD